MAAWLFDLEIGSGAKQQLVPPLGSALFDAFLELDTFIRHESDGAVRKSWSHQGHQLILMCGGDFQKLKVSLHLLADPQATSAFVGRICQLLQSHGLSCLSRRGGTFVGADRLREIMQEGQSRPPLRDLLQLREDLLRAGKPTVLADKPYFDGLRRLARGEA